MDGLAARHEELARDELVKKRVGKVRELWPTELYHEGWEWMSQRKLRFEVLPSLEDATDHV